MLKKVGLFLVITIFAVAGLLAQKARVFDRTTGLFRDALQADLPIIPASGCAAGQMSTGTVEGGGASCTEGNVLQSVSLAEAGACNSGRQGKQFLVTDALLPAFLGIVVAGGSVKTAVFCNGTNWVAH